MPVMIACHAGMDVSGTHYHKAMQTLFDIVIHSGQTKFAYGQHLSMHVSFRMACGEEHAPWSSTSLTAATATATHTT